ncbi:MAG TPA: ATP-binding protein [Candidatus Bathyarchaeia archaeon]|nr:ATP-binding protein [Candidatus Bathyarchaeia archaeon]
MSAEEEERIKNEALIDNTAQGIFNYLKEVENKREIYEKRWIWELLQNALDAASHDRTIEVKIIKDEKKLIFKHNGLPFKSEEVAHLIFHGSQKKSRILVNSEQVFL